MTTENTFWQHAFNSMAHYFLYTILLCTKLRRCVEALSTWVTSIVRVNLVGFFLARKSYFIGIDNDYLYWLYNTGDYLLHCLRNQRVE